MTYPPSSNPYGYGPPPGYPPPQPPKKSNTLVIVLAVIGGLLALCCLGGVVLVVIAPDTPEDSTTGTTVARPDILDPTTHIKFTRCEADTGTQRLAVEATVTNPGPKPATYVMSGEVLDETGRRVSPLLGTSEAIGVGAPTTVKFIAGGASAGKVTCKLAQVRRTEV